MTRVKLVGLDVHADDCGRGRGGGAGRGSKVAGIALHSLQKLIQTAIQSTAELGTPVVYTFSSCPGMRHRR
jgi:hypothetical protein